MRLQFPPVNIDAPRDYQVAAAIRDVRIPLLIQPTQISQAEPAFPVAGLRFGLVVKVPKRTCLPLTPGIQLPYLALGSSIMLGP